MFDLFSQSNLPDAPAGFQLYGLNARWGSEYTSAMVFKHVKGTPVAAFWGDYPGSDGMGYFYVLVRTGR